MKKQLLGGVLVAITMAAIAYMPVINARNVNNAQTSLHIDVQQPQASPIIDVVFVLDTTGSMAGLIETAKQKIWSIASTMASAQPAPTIRMGLVGYRDRGDEYVVRTVDLSADLDSMYAELMQFQAGGGGDGPESVNAALAAAVNDLSWSEALQAYQVVFLLGDAPPHMDYQDEAQYPEILATARQKGIVVNAIQCGTVAGTYAPWLQIAKLGAGSFWQVGQAGSAVAHATPFDDELATLSARLDSTRLYYGTREEKRAMADKVAAAESIAASAPAEARARRGAFNVSAAGRSNRLGDNELVEAVASGDIDLAELDAELLPEAMQSMSAEEQHRHVTELAEQRAEAETRMQTLAAARDDYLREAVREAGGAADSLDQKLYDTIRQQGAAVGLEYAGGPAY